jgi:hypothetical protein
MAYTVNWATRVVTIPKTDLTVVSATPEIYELDLIDFWTEIHDIQDSEGMPYPNIMRSNAPTTISGVTYARSVEVINNYKIEFEDGQYQVNLVGANNNLLDTRTQNQVSLNASNSAGLINGGWTTAQEAKIDSIKTTVDALPTAAEIWDEEISNFVTNGTVGKELADAMSMITDMWQIEGLDDANPMTVTTTQRTVGSITQNITGNGTTTSTVTRQ